MKISVKSVNSIIGKTTKIFSRPVLSHPVCRLSLENTVSVIPHRRRCARTERAAPWRHIWRCSSVLAWWRTSSATADMCPGRCERASYDARSCWSWDDTYRHKVYTDGNTDHSPRWFPILTWRSTTVPVNVDAQWTSRRCIVYATVTPMHRLDVHPRGRRPSSSKRETPGHRQVAP